MHTSFVMHSQVGTRLLCGHFIIGGVSKRERARLAAPSQRAREFSSENLTASRGKLFCKACRECLVLKRSVIVSHIKCRKQKERVRVVMALMQAGIPLEKLECQGLRDLLQGNAFRLTDTRHMRDLVLFFRRGVIV